MSLLLTIDYVGIGIETYFIPHEETLPKPLLSAVKKMHGVYCNSDEFEDGYYKPWAFLQAATMQDPENLSERNEYEERRFAHALVPFLLPEDKIKQGKPYEFEVSGKLIVVQTGSY